MKTEAEICQDALLILNEKIGPVETEVFISVLLRDPFDYTEWQKTLWEGKSLKEIFDAAKEHEHKIMDSASTSS